MRSRRTISRRIRRLRRRTLSSFEQPVLHLVDRHLGPDQDSLSVRQLERQRVKRIVGAGHRGAEVLQHRDVVAQIAGAKCRAADEVVLVHARPAQVHGLIVQQQAAAPHLEAADARMHGVALDDVPVAVAQQQLDRVERRLPGLQRRGCGIRDRCPKPAQPLGETLVGPAATWRPSARASSEAVAPRAPMFRTSASIERLAPQVRHASRGRTFTLTRSRRVDARAGRPRAGCRRSSTSRPRSDRRGAPRATGHRSGCAGCRP